MSTEETKTILVVDDDEMNREVLEAFLTSENYQVLLANTGQLGLRLAEDERPDLIMLDIRMPDMDGYSVCRHLKRQAVTRDIPVLVITGYDSPEDRQRSLNAGANEFLARPFSGKALLQTVDGLLSARNP